MMMTTFPEKYYLPYIRPTTTSMHKLKYCRLIIFPCLTPSYIELNRVPNLKKIYTINRGGGLSKRFSEIYFISHRKQTRIQKLIMSSLRETNYMCKNIYIYEINCPIHKTK